MSTVELITAADRNDFRRLGGRFRLCESLLALRLCVIRSRYCQVHAKPQIRKAPPGKTRLALVGELDVHLMRNDAALVAFGEQAAHGFTAAFAVVES
jgi:hypothetical protein